MMEKVLSASKIGTKREKTLICAAATRDSVDRKPMLFVIPAGSRGGSLLASLYPIPL